MFLAESTIDTNWIYVFAGILAGAIGWFGKFWWDWQKKKRENNNEEIASHLKNQNEEAAAELLRRKNELSLVNAPLNFYIQKLEEEIKTLKVNMEIASQQNLTKIFESITKETECQKKNAILEEKCRYLTEQVQELRQRISVLEKNNE